MDPTGNDRWVHRNPLALAALLLMPLAGCTGATPRPAAAPAAPPASPPAGSAGPAGAASPCPSARVRFGATRATEPITGVSPVMVITDRTGGPLDEPLETISTPTAAVSAGPGVPADLVYRRLAADERFAGSPLVPLGTVHRPGDDSSTHTAGGSGEFVRYEFVRRLEVPFTYACGTAQSTGTVTTWEDGHNTGTLQCDDPEPRDDAGSREVRKLRC